jgi:hypothetical protein
METMEAEEEMGPKMAEEEVMAKGEIMAKLVPWKKHRKQKDRLARNKASFELSQQILSHKFIHNIQSNPFIDSYFIVYYHQFLFLF